jgi:hypothetical protein
VRLAKCVAADLGHMVTMDKNIIKETMFSLEEWPSKAPAESTSTTLLMLGRVD